MSEQELQISPSKETFSLVPRDLAEAMKFAELISSSDLVPKDYKGKPANVVIAMQMGMEVGLPPLQAIQQIAVINGRPAVWGDAMLALVKNHKMFEWIDESYDDATKTAVCKIKRKGEPAQVRVFSEDDARNAGLLNKEGPWKTYRKRMQQLRARGFALRDVFPDALRGLRMAEEEQDIKDMGEAERLPPDQTVNTGRPQLQEYPQDQFEKNLHAWQDAIASGKKTPEQIVAMVSSKGVLSEDQKKMIRDGIAKQDEPKQEQPESREPGSDDDWTKEYAEASK